MPILIDTNVAIHLRDGDPEVTRKVNGLTDVVMLSIVSWVELEGGILGVPASAPFRRRRVDEILKTFIILPFGEAEAVAYRTIVEATGHSRRKLLDRMIAAQALVQGASLVTCNAAAFRDVPGLRLIEW